MKPDRHTMACALKVEEMHGDLAPLHIAERIGALALVGDAEGVEMWRKIAAAYQGLQKPKSVNGVG